MAKTEVVAIIVLVTILTIQLEVFCVSSEQKRDLNDNLEEKQDWNYTQNDTINDARVAICKDRGLPNKFSKDKNCKKLKLNCSKLSSNCNSKLGSKLRKPGTEKKCLKKLSPSERKKKVKSYCQQTCKECVNGGWCSWGTWGDCSETCGDGIKTRTRACECPPKKGVGSLCLGNGLQNSRCNEATCLASFTKTASRSCYQNDYGRYDTLDEAKLACSNDSECSGIYDVFCNGPPFVLCPMKKYLKYSKSSCTYIKDNLAETVLPTDLPLNCAKAEGCQVLDGITNIALETGFVEYILGDKESKLILTSPHGGYIKEESIPTRLPGCTGEVGDVNVTRKGCIFKHDESCADYKSCYAVTTQDENSQEIMRLAADQIKQTSGLQPHMIISLLHRSRLDPNREDLQAAQGDPIALKAYKEFHSAINHAKSIVKRGLLIDFHGFNKDWEVRNRTEVGYLISKGPLNDGEFEPSETSFRSLVKRKNLDKRFFLGNESLGALLEKEGYFAVPSPNRSPGDVRYYRGGFITRYHGSRYDNNDEVDAVQIEFPRQLRMGGEKVVNDLGKSVGNILVQFYQTWYS